MQNQKLDQKIIIGAPVRQNKTILKEFLDSLLNLDSGDIILDFIFVDDNIDPESSTLLQEFKPSGGKVRTISPDALQGTYLCDENAHHWDEQLIWKIAGYKDQIIKYACENNYDYLFLVDSDLLLQPKTILNLLVASKDIISEVFWTKWQPGSKLMPQVWLSDVYSFFPADINPDISENEKIRFEDNFIETMKQPGIYKVGGLGACTLISRKALQKGVSFKQIKNLSFWGEDRHFCVRAAILGLELYADTSCPPLHIYRQTELEKIPYYKNFLKKSKSTREIIEYIFDLNPEKQLFLESLQLIDNKDFTKAYNILSKLVDKDKEGQYLFHLGFTSFKLHRFQESIKYLSNALQKDFYNKYELFYLTALALEQIGQNEVAAAYYKKAEAFKGVYPNQEFFEML